ncbi:hypothetical protein EMPS_10134 [Entomortierella parvispora]|uniref:Uncharacterized protein n=1 Tax=Entomortierella parvispora TaxID=205924 RepID=A0A9P3HJC5_9FUNG|nr:hypothetical protein EMPS_10134 [Entomortierella parvispora]
MQATTLRYLTTLVAFLCFVCFGLDIARVCFDPAEKKSKNTVLVFITDIVGLLPYIFLTLRMNKSSKQHRFISVLYRILFFALVMIAPCLELRDAHTLNKMLNAEGPTAFEDPVFLGWLDDDLGRYCWGAVRPALEMADPTQNIHSACIALRTRTMLSLIVAFFVLIELVLYKKSSIGTEAWVQERTSYKAESHDGEKRSEV